VIAGLLALVVGATIVEASHPANKKHVVHGTVSPVLQSFLADPRVQHELAHKGFTVVADGSNADFTFTTDPQTNAARVFATPLVATASPTDAQQLERIGLAHQNDSVWSIDTTKLMNAIAAHQIAVHTDGPTSPSGSYLAALLAGLRPNDDVPALVNAIRPAFAQQSTGVPVVNFAFASDAHASGDVVMYPNPDVVASAAVTSHSALGADFARTLATDSTVRGAAPTPPPVPINAASLPTPQAFAQLTQLLNTAVHI
jgi:hypothetical protein